MTKVFFYKKNNKFVAIESKGHTGFDIEGKDILCASISSIIQSCILGMRKVVGITNDMYKINEKKGTLEYKLPESLSEDQRYGCDILFDTMYESILDLVDGYPNYILMEVIEDVY